MKGLTPMGWFESKKYLTERVARLEAEALASNTAQSQVHEAFIAEQRAHANTKLAHAEQVKELEAREAKEVKRCAKNHLDRATLVKAEADRRLAEMTATAKGWIEAHSTATDELTLETLRIAWQFKEPNVWTIPALDVDATISKSGRWTLTDGRNGRQIITDDYPIVELVVNEIREQRIATLQAKKLLGTPAGQTPTTANESEK